MCSVPMVRLETYDVKKEKEKDKDKEKGNRCWGNGIREGNQRVHREPRRLNDIRLNGIHRSGEQTVSKSFGSEHSHSHYLDNS
ncbi:hypothetical protein M0802_009270 [Mischocyttarus mexicanus]|nr:hypothetical protein M0802_009270 [Mischocyttarus mexicanus]